MIGSERVKIVYQGHWVKVTVIRAKRLYLVFMGGLPLSETQSVWLVTVATERVNLAKLPLGVEELSTWSVTSEIPAEEGY